MAGGRELMAKAEVSVVPILQDNYVYLLHDEAGGETAVVDVGEAAPVRDALESRGWRPSQILVTHRHGDHIAGVAELAKAYGAKVVGPAAEAADIPEISLSLKEGDVVKVGSLRGEVFAFPGHTMGHIAYWFADALALFCGDVLFSLGCGRVFEGTHEQMWDSLRRLRDLPREALVYCGHEYTKTNLAFALSVDGDNEALKRRGEEVKAQRAAGHPTLPSRLGDECAANPFLRADDSALAARLGLAGAEPWQVFAELRKRRDVFADTIGG